MLTCRTLSVVVIGRNEGLRLTNCLRSVAAMNYPEQLLELIYVDSGSSDGSVEQAASMGATTITLVAPFTAARARNAGWRRASGEFILFLDGDTMVDPNFVHKALPQFADPGIAAVFGNRRESNPGSSLFNRVLDYDWLAPDGFTDFFGGDALVRRSALVQVNGYRDDLIAGEEPEMCARIRQQGSLILHIDEPMTLHDLAMHSWPQYWRRAVRTGHAYAEISSALRRTSTPLWTYESRKNFIQGSVYLLLPALALLAAIVSGSVWPLVLVALAFCLLILRTALRFRSRVHDRADRLLYAIHSHLQQAPIVVGQIGYKWSQFTGRRRQLIEYHRSAQ